MLLKIVSFTWNIACYFDSVRKTNSGDLTKSGVRLFRGCSLNGCADTTLLWRSSLDWSLCKRIEASLQCGRLRLLCFLTNWLNVGIFSPPIIIFMRYFTHAYVLYSANTILSSKKEVAHRATPFLFL